MVVDESQLQYEKQPLKISKLLMDTQYKNDANCDIKNIICGGGSFSMYSMYYYQLKIYL